MTRNKHEVRLRDMADDPSLDPGEQEACIAGADAISAICAAPTPPADLARSSLTYFIGPDGVRLESARPETAAPTPPADPPGLVAIERKHRVPDDVMALARSGRLIDGIKLLRHDYGLPLKDAKELVEDALRIEKLRADAAAITTPAAQPVTPPLTLDDVEQVREALLAANRMANVLYNLPLRVQADGRALLSGKDLDDLRRTRLGWEVIERPAYSTVNRLAAALASPAGETPAPEGT